MTNFSVLDCPIYFDKTNMLDMLSLSAGRAILCQNRMGERIVADNSWGLNPTDGIIRFGDKQFRAGILGTESTIQGTWLWSWAHTESGLPEKSVAESCRAKKNLPELPEFQTGKFELDEMRSGHNLAMIACAATRENLCYYRCPYDGGAAFVTISGLPDDIFAPADQPEFLRQYIEIISGFYCDHRLLAAGFLWQNGTPFVCDENSVTADFGHIRLRFLFESAQDGLNRVLDISTVD